MMNLPLTNKFMKTFYLSSLLVLIFTGLMTLAGYLEVAQTNFDPQAIAFIQFLFLTPVGWGILLLMILGAFLTAYGIATSGFKNVGW